MTKSELYQKGDAMRRSMYGEEAYNKANETVYGDPIMQSSWTLRLRQFWSSMDAPGLGHKDKSFSLCCFRYCNSARRRARNSSTFCFRSRLDTRRVT